MAAYVWMKLREGVCHAHDDALCTERLGGAADGALRPGPGEAVGGAYAATLGRSNALACSSRARALHVQEGEGRQERSGSRRSGGAARGAAPGARRAGSAARRTSRTPRGARWPPSRAARTPTRTCAGLPRAAQHSGVTRQASACAHEPPCNRSTCAVVCEHAEATASGRCMLRQRLKAAMRDASCMLVLFPLACVPACPCVKRQPFVAHGSINKQAGNLCGKLLGHNCKAHHLRTPRPGPRLPSGRAPASWRTYERGPSAPTTSRARSRRPHARPSSASAAGAAPSPPAPAAGSAQAAWQREVWTCRGSPAPCLQPGDDAELPGELACQAEKQVRHIAACCTGAASGAVQTAHAIQAGRSPRCSSEKGAGSCRLSSCACQGTES